MSHICDSKYEQVFLTSALPWEDAHIALGAPVGIEVKIPADCLSIYKYSWF